VLGEDLAHGDLKDPDLPEQTMTPRRALAELGRIRRQEIQAGRRRIKFVTRRSALQATVLKAFPVDTLSWNRTSLA
jgi:hypothetical protein